MIWYASLLANIIVSQYFNELRCIIVFSDEQCDLQYSGKLPVLQVGLKLGRVPQRINYNKFGCKGLIVCNAYPLTTLKTFELNIKNRTDRINERKYLFVPSTGVKENLFSIFTAPELRFLADLLIIVPEGNSSSNQCLRGRLACTNFPAYELVTHQFVGKSGHNNKMMLDEWFSNNQSFLLRNNLYSDKMKNLKGRLLKLSTFTYLPYTVVDPITGVADGSEIQMILEYVRRHNATLEFVVDEEAQWGKIHPNWTGIGVGGNLAKDVSDIGASAMFRWENEYNYLDFAKSFIRTGVTTLLPAPRRANGWLTPILSFTGMVWITVVFSYLLSSLAFFLFKMYGSRRKSLKSYEMEYYKSSLTIYMIFMLQSLHKEILLYVNKSSQIFLGTMFLYCFLLATSYSSGLASNLAIPRYEDAIDTAQQFANSPLYWSGTHAGAWVASIEADNETMYKTIVSKFIETNITEIKKMIHSRKSGIPIERLPSGHYAISKYIGKSEVEKLRPMSTDLYFELTVVMTRKNSIFLPSLDNLILKVYESGLPLYWEGQVVRKYLNMSVQMAIKHSLELEKQKVLIKLSVNHISGAMAVWLIGLIVATICFLYEFFYYRRGLYKFVH